MQGVKQLVYPFDVVVGTKIARSLVVGICAYCRHNESIDIDEKLASLHTSNCNLLALHIVQHACGLSTTPTVLVCADATQAH